MVISVEMSGEEVRQALLAHVLKDLCMSRACFDIEKSTVQTTDYLEIRGIHGSITVTLLPPEVKP